MEKCKGEGGVQVIVEEKGEEEGCRREEESPVISREGVFRQGGAIGNAYVESFAF